MVKESVYQKAILDYLTIKGIYCWRNQSTGIYNAKTGGYIPLSKAGVSDILGILPDGRLLAIEVKVPKGKLSPAQQQFLDDINQRGGLAFMATTIDDVIQSLSTD